MVSLRGLSNGEGKDMKWLTAEALRVAVAMALFLAALVMAPGAVQRACLVLAVPAAGVVEP